MFPIYYTYFRFRATGGKQRFYRKVEDIAEPDGQIVSAGKSPNAKKGFLHWGWHRLQGETAAGQGSFPEQSGLAVLHSQSHGGSSLGGVPLCRVDRGDEQAANGSTIYI